MSVRVEHADMLEAIPRLVTDGVVCDAVVTDPPYHLVQISERSKYPVKYGKDGAMQRLLTGFMGQTWDGGDIAFRPETWATVGTILRPGAFLVAFGGTRTYHRLACAIEDGGFVIQDCLMWLFATGFPKRRDMLKPAWESILLAQKPVVLEHVVPDIMRMLCELRASLDQMAMSQSGTTAIIALSTVSSWLDILEEYSARASTFTTETESKTTIDWKTLKSCLSAITPESIILAHRNGHLSNADASPAIRYSSASVHGLSAILGPSATELAISPGLTERLDAIGVGIEPIVLAYKPGGKRTMQVDECRIEGGREQEQEQGNYAGSNVQVVGPRNGGKIYPVSLGRWPANICHDGSDEVLAAFPDSAGQQGDVRGTEPSRPGLNCYGEFGPRKPFAARGKRPAGFADVGADRGDPAPNGPTYGNSGSAARFFFSSKAGKSDRWGSRHPTVKPVELMKWLVALVTPPGGLVLDPFAGSGTTGVAALATGRNAILIEREAAYIADIRERMAHYEGSGRHSLASKSRQARPRGNTPLLDHRPYDAAADAIGSYNDAVRAIGEQVKAGAPVPDFFLPDRLQRRRITAAREALPLFAPLGGDST